MSSKKKQVSAIPADFGQYIYDINEKKPYSTKKPQNHSICDQISFGIQLQTFP